ncbi:hypothetical protein C2G38_2204416 [Gigaspora rosea]|uniref:Uncharacterized protein n=1 Tax=Gigaspora rosea TaxID=44941 RepID=A0A397UU78_9GLOM|nr:hypothetical protein C2G38_2204416 [Gigaspora rosea]
MTLKEAWPEAYDIVMPLYDAQFFKSDSTVWALIVIAQETTQKVLNAQRLKLLSEFKKQMPEIT